MTLDIVMVKTMLNKSNISVLIQSLVDKQCISVQDADEILSRSYKDFLALEASLDLDYSVDPAAFNIKQLTNIEDSEYV